MGMVLTAYRSRGGGHTGVRSLHRMALRYALGCFLGPGANGAARGTRTPDPVITNDVLYQLSYCGIKDLATVTDF